MLDRDHWNIVNKLNINNWSTELHNLSFDSVCIPITPAQNAILLEGFQKDDQFNAAILENALAPYRSFIEQGVFIKYFSRSPKDSYQFINSYYRCTTISQIVQALYCSERVVYDSYIAKEHNLPIFLTLRKWEAIPKTNEYRCFIRNRELIAVAQYHQFDIAEHNKAMIELKIKVLIHEILLNLDLDIKDIVIDITSSVYSKAKLIELNPYAETTDPISYTWEELNNIPYFSGVRYLPKQAESSNNTIGLKLFKNVL